MGLFFDLANRPDQPVQDVSNAPMTQEQFAQQNPNSSNPDYDYMLYQNQQQQAAKAQADAQLQQSDPKAYNAQKAQSLADDLFTSFTNNGHGFGGTSTHEAENTAALDAFKQTDPNAYYNAQLSLDLRKAGWDAGQGKTNDITNARIQSNMQDALKAGFNPNQIQNLVANNYANTAQWHAQNIADRQGQGATLQGIEKVAPAFAAMITAGALAPAAGAVAGETALGTTGAGSIDAYMAGAGLDAGSFGGSAFTVPELASAAYTSPTDYMNQAGLDAGTFNNFTPTNPLTDYMNQAGLDSGTYTGANFQMPTGLSAADALKYANQARQGLGVASTLSKLLGGSGAGGATGGATGGTTGGTATATTSGLSPQQLAKYLTAQAPVQTAAVPYQIKMNQNPFTFNIPGQTQATQGMYDVSGVNPMANALRTA